LPCGIWTQGLHLEPLHQHFVVLGIFEIGFLKLFAQGWLWTAILPDLCLLSS
jgi:hypothetical protein